MLQSKTERLTLRTNNLIMDIFGVWIWMVITRQERDGIIAVHKWAEHTCEPSRKRNTSHCAVISIEQIILENKVTMAKNRPESQAGELDRWSQGISDNITNTPKHTNNVVSSNWLTDCDWQPKHAVANNLQQVQTEPTQRVVQICVMSLILVFISCWK